MEELNRMQEKYIEYATKAPIIQLVKHRIASMPTCSRCGAVALRDRRPYDPPGEVMVTCPVCGHHGPPGPPFRMMVREMG